MPPTHPSSRDSSPDALALNEAAAALDPATRAALGTAVQQGRIARLEVAQAWLACGRSGPAFARWVAERFAPTIADTVVQSGGRSSGRAPVAGAPNEAVTLVQGSGSGRVPAAAGPAAERIGPYVVEKELARGGMGVVYVATHAQLGRRVALKLLLGAGKDEELERFQLEAQATARLKHPNIVGVHDVGVENGKPWLAMDLIEGESLHARISRDGALKEEEAVEVVEKVSRAMAYAHKAGLLHRDIKPHNVLLDREGEPFLADFGLAKDVKRAAKGVTVTGQVLGTPAYMPPEQAAGDADLVDRRSDVYSLGATLFHALTGQLPFDGPTPVNVITKVLTSDVPRPSSLRPRLDRDLETVVLHAMEKDPAQRYPTALALAEDLRRWREGAPIVARPVGALARLWRRVRRNRGLSGAVAAVAVALVAVWVAFTVRLERSRDQERSAKEDAQRAKAVADDARAQAIAEQEKARRAEALALLANDRLALERRLDAGVMLLSLARYGEAKREFDGARADAERPGRFADEERAAFVAAAARGAREAALHLGHPVTGSDEDGWPTRACAFSPAQGARVLASLERDEVVVRDLERGGQVLLRASVDGPVEGGALAFTPDGRTLVAAVSLGDRSTEAAWEVPSGRERWRRSRVARRVTALALGPGGDVVAIGDLAGLTTFSDVLRGTPACAPARGEQRRGCENNRASTYAIAFAPPEVGPVVALGYADGLINLFDLRTGAFDERFTRNITVAPTAMAWPPLGALGGPEQALLVLADGQGRVWTYDLGTHVRREPPLLDGEGGRVHGLAVHTRGAEPLIAAATDDGTVWLWDRTGRERRRLRVPAGQALSCAFSADGQRLAVAGPRPPRVWDTSPRRLSGHGPLAFSRDGRAVVALRTRPVTQTKTITVPGRGTLEGVADRRHELALHDLETGREQTLELTNEYGVLRFTAVATAPDGSVLIATREDHELFLHRRLWTWTPGRRDARPSDTGAATSVIEVTPEGDRALLCGLIDRHRGELQADVQVRDLGSGAASGAPRTWHPRTIVGCALLPDGGFLTLGEEGSLARWSLGATRPEAGFDARSGAPLSKVDAELPELPVRPFGLSYSPERRLVAVALGDGSARLWRLDAPDPAPFSLQGHASPLLLCAFVGDGDLLVTAGRDGRARLWDVPRRAVLRTIEPPVAVGRLEHAALSPDGRRLALAAAGDVWVYELGE